MLKKVSEKNNSRTSPACCDKKGKNLTKRGNFNCKKYSYKNHVIRAVNVLKTYQYGSFFERNVPNCNSRVNSGNVAKWDPSHLTCTEVPSVRAV
ncbi:MAG: hypothetical protein ACETVN_05025 [Asgard group archaeon]